MNKSGGHTQIQVLKSKCSNPSAQIQVLNAMKSATGATGERLEEILAAFLIVAEQTSFFGYGWFYDMESEYAPCDDGGGDNRTLCLAPDGIYPEFKQPLGPPKGLAVQDGTEWSREFAHASVVVDVANTTRNHIIWRAPGSGRGASLSANRHYKADVLVSPLCDVPFPSVQVTHPPPLRLSHGFPRLGFS